MPDIFDQLAGQSRTVPASAGGDIFTQLAAQGQAGQSPQRSEPDLFDAMSEKPLVSGESTFNWLLDLINTPQQMVFGMMTKKDGETLWQAAKRGARNDLTGADVVLPYLYEDIAKTGREPTWWDIAKGTIASTAFDLIVDPLNLIPFGKLASGGRAVSKALKGTSTFARTMEKIEPVAKPLARLFSKKAFASEAERKVIDLIDLNRARLQASRADILEDAIKREKLVQDVAKQTGRAEQDVRRIVLDLQEAPHQKQLTLFPEQEAQQAVQAVKKVERVHDPSTHGTGQLDFWHTEQFDTTAGEIKQALQGVRKDAPKELVDLALQFKNSAEDILLAEQKHGLPTEELADSLVDYALHLLTPEAKKAIAKSPEFVGLGRKFSPAHASQIARQLRGKSVAEINELAKAGKLPGFDGQVFKKFMVDDPVALEAVRRLRSAKAIADVDLLGEAAVKLGAPAYAAPNHWVELGIVHSSDPRLRAVGEMFKGIMFDPDVAQHLNKTVALTTLPEGLNQFLKLYDSVQGIWKGITLSVFPAYHMRNIVGNLWNNALAGLADPEWYRRAAQLQSGVDKTFKIAGKEVDAAILRTMLKDFGVTGKGFVSGEVPGITSRTLRQGFSINDIHGVRKAVRKGFEMGGHFEDNARIAHFLWKLDQGASPIEAAMSVKKYLFDYVEGLTDFEKSVMRRIMPFYAWTRFNVPLQASALINNPRPFIHLAQIVRTSRSDEPGLAPDEFHKSILPEFISENSGIPVRMAEDGNPEYFLLGGWIPAADLEVLARPHGVLDKALSLLSPLIKMPAEQAFNVDLFMKRKIEEYPGEKQKFLGMNVRRRLVHFMRFFRVASEIDRLSRGALEKELTDDEMTRLGAALR